jgi:hypothetical protein
MTNRFQLKNYTNIYYLYIFSIFVFAAYYIFRWSIFAGDTDLWYHMNGGRYILQYGIIPKDSYFSFITPPREWVDYYWLFQVIAFKIYSFTDYYGLVYFRAIIFISITLFIVVFLFKGQAKTSYLHLTILFVLTFLFLLARYQLIRPHMFTYLFIVMFIYILELKPKYVFLLPLIGILWTNLHGIEYPVMLLICLSYIVQFFIRHLVENKHIQKDGLAYIIPLIVTIGTVYLTPHGNKLTYIPFIPTAFASHYIQELGSFQFSDMISFNMVKMSLQLTTIFNLLFFLTCVSFITSLFLKKLKISHFLLFLGGIVLLSRGRRFGYEFILLAMPVLREGALSFTLSSLQGNIKKFISIIILLTLSVIPFVNLQNLFVNLPRFPFSQRNLPDGIITFLKHINTGGTVFNNPDYGGYMQWSLYPRYKIFMDMEIPFLFNNEDIFFANNVFMREPFVKQLVEGYDPSFITVPIKHNSFKELIKPYKQYIPVFFDDIDVLYVNKNHFPSIADRYSIKIIDPFTLANQSTEYIKNSMNTSEIMNELKRIIEIYPESGVANNCFAIFYINNDQFEKALLHAERIINIYPESQAGYNLKGDALKGLKKYNEAIDYYKTALKKVDSVETHRQIGLVYLSQKNYKKAYDTLIGSINIYSSYTTYKDLYYVIQAAVMCGKNEEAQILFKYAYSSIPENDRSWHEKYNKLQSIMQEKAL